MLGTLPCDKKQTWSKFVAPLVHAYNSTKHDSTGFSPYHIMFGREPRLPIDLCFGTTPNGVSHREHTQYVQNLRRNLEGAYRLAAKESAKSAAANKRRYDVKVRGTDLQIGDRVLIRNVGFQGPHKLADKWNPDVYLVVGRSDGNIPVYQVKSELGSSVVRTLHRNMILPIGGIAPEASAPAAPAPVAKTRRKSKPESLLPPSPGGKEDEEKSDMEEPEVVVIWPNSKNSQKDSGTSLLVKGSGLDVDKDQTGGTGTFCPVLKSNSNSSGSTQGQCPLNADAEVFVPTSSLSPSTRSEPLESSAPMAVHDQLLETSIAGSLSEASTKAGGECSDEHVLDPAGQSVGPEDVTENAEEEVILPNCDLESLSDSPTCDTSGVAPQSLEVVDNTGVESHWDDQVETEMSVDDSVPSDSSDSGRCPESSSISSEDQSASEVGSISDPHPQELEEDEGSQSGHASRPTRTRFPPKRYTYDKLGEPTCQTVQAQARSSWIPEFCRSIFPIATKNVFGTIQHI